MKNNPIFYIFLFLWLTVSYNSQFADMSMPIIGFGINVLLGASLMAITFPSVLKFRLNIYQKWILIICLYWVASASWSVNPEASDFLFSVVISYMFCFFTSSQLSTKNDIGIVLKTELIALFLCGFYVLLFVNTGDLSEERLGGDTDGLWNANDIGLKMSVGYAISVYFLLRERANRPLQYGLILFFIVVSLLSGSRKVIIILTVFTALLMIIRSKGQKKILYVAFAILFLGASFFAIMNIPVLYGILGRRIDLMIAGLHGEDGGHSMILRAQMISEGVMFWLQKPIFGNGFNSFYTLFYNITGLETYSHNNFIELLVNTGVVGLLLYYSLTFYILKGLWKPAFHNKDTLAQVLFLYSIISFVLDYAVVSYPSIPTIFRLMYTARYCQLLKEGETLSPRTR